MAAAFRRVSPHLAASRRQVDAHSNDRVSVLTVHRIVITWRGAVEASGRRAACALNVTVLPGTSSGEHKFKILGLLMAAVDAAKGWLPPGATAPTESKHGLFFPGMDVDLPTAETTRSS